MKPSNPYSCTAFKNKSFFLDGEWAVKGDKVGFMKYVNDVRSYISWLEKNHISWDHINVYERKSRRFLLRVLANDYLTWISKPNITF